ncbi:MAG: preprotein translocase subunit SecE [Nodosilinea sp.]
MAKKDGITETTRKAVEVKDASDGFNPGGFLQETREELSKVVWPGRQQLISESAAVILMVSLSATLIYLVDQLFGWISKQVF